MSTTGRLILVRHGETFGNLARVFSDDPAALPLTERGYAQARAVAGRIAELYRPVVVVTSPFLRARETARIIADRLQSPLQIEANLYEREIGTYRGRSYDSPHFASDYDPAAHWLWKPAGGESYAEVKTRVAPVIDRLAREYPAEDVVIVSHGGVMMCVWAHVMGSWEAAHVAPNCGVVCLDHGPAGFSPPQIIEGGTAQGGSTADAGG